MREVVECCLQANIEVQPPRGDVIRISTAISKCVLVRLMRLCYSFTRQLSLAGEHEEAIKGDCEGKYVITSDFRFLPIVSHKKSCIRSITNNRKQISTYCTFHYSDFHILHYCIHVYRNL